jgi:circadian clock protein KaiB
MATLLVQALEVWDFEIFIAGETPKAKLAYANLRSICDQYLANNCKITMQDISKNPKLARENQITAIPTIIRKNPLPKKTLIGDLSDVNRAVSKLELCKPR